MNFEKLKGRGRILVLAVLFFGIWAFLKPVSTEAEVHFEKDVDDVWLIDSYEELVHAAKMPSNGRERYRLSADIIQKDTVNGNEIVVDVWSELWLDLNGYTISRETRSLDTSLFTVKGNMIIWDSSEKQTGTCEFTSTAPSGTCSVIFNDGEGFVIIRGGNYLLNVPNSTYANSVLFAENGDFIIYDGLFDSRNAYDANSILLYHYDSVYDVPHCEVYGGTFFSNENNIEISPFSNFAPKGCLYPSVYVIDGDFYLTRAGENSGGFAYCSNRWGRVLVAGGFGPKNSLNNDAIYLPGTQTDTAYVSIDGGQQISYYSVTPPPMILSEGIDANDRLFVKCRTEEAKSYKNYSAIQASMGDLLDEYIHAVDILEVDAKTAVSPELYVENAEKNDTIRWYTATEEVYAGEETPWVELTEYQNQTGPWRLENRPEEDTTLYYRIVVERIDGSTIEDVFGVHYEELIRTLQGNLVIGMNNPHYGNAVTAMVYDAPEDQKEADYHYEWKIDGQVVGTEKRFELNKIFYIGKKLYCSVTSDTHEGTLTAMPVVVRKAINQSVPDYMSVSYKEGTISLVGTQNDQEYLFTTKPEVSHLTEEDWANALRISAPSAGYTLEHLGLEEQLGETIFVYTRFAETDTHRAGSRVIRTSAALKEVVPLQSLIFPDAVNNSIFIPFTGAGDIVEITYDPEPLNATAWNDFTWRASYPVSVAEPTGPVSVDNNTGIVKLKLITTGTTSLTASYITNTEIFYARVNIVVYDPENPSIGSANLVTPLEDQTIGAGQIWMAEMPTFIPEVPESMELTWYLSKRTQNSFETFTECDVAKINPVTGEIMALAPGTVEVSLMGTNTAIDTFTLTVVPVLPYEDVSEADWFYEAVYYNYVQKTMTGMDATHFGPYGSLSRAQFALILYRMEGEPEFTAIKNFNDISGSEWYGPAVLWAAENGIVTGYQSGDFGPADMITREQMALMMYRYADYLGLNTDTKADISKFKDGDCVSDFAKEAMSWANGMGIITGKEEGTLLAPQAKTARAEAAAIIQRFMSGLGR